MAAIQAALPRGTQPGAVATRRRLAALTLALGAFAGAAFWWALPRGRLRLTKPALDGVMALRLAVTRPQGSHALVPPPEPRAFDIEEFLSRQIVRYISMRGAVVRDDHGLMTQDLAVDDDPAIEQRP